MLGADTNTKPATKSVMVGPIPGLAAFREQVVGTKVLNPEGFWAAARTAVERFDSSRTGFVSCPEAIPFISGAFGARTMNPGRMHIVTYRGRLEYLLKRQHAMPVVCCELIVGTRENYLADLNREKDAEEIRRVRASSCTHILYSVLTSPELVIPYPLDDLLEEIKIDNPESPSWKLREILAKLRVGHEFKKEYCLVAD
ncbi:MAG: hypothetical protein PHV93_00085 [Candidatus Pacebacteria bacterium]|nr:hypothetical protein [Candidatus Paceibacterota bacterium]